MTTSLTFLPVFAQQEIETAKSFEIRLVLLLVSPLLFCILSDFEFLSTASPKRIKKRSVNCLREHSFSNKTQICLNESIVVAQKKVLKTFKAFNISLHNI